MPNWRLGALAVLMYSVYRWWWLTYLVAAWRTHGPEYSQLRPLVLEPEGLRASLRAVPERRLDREEHEALRRDGVLRVKGLFPNRTLLKELDKGIAPFATYFEAGISQSYLFNGHVRALMLESPLAALGADALGEDRVKLWETPIFGSEGLPHVVGQWHVDARGMFTDVMSIWLSLRDAPHSLEFLRGSHRLSEELQLQCNQTRFGGSSQFNVQHKCAEAFAKERLEPQIGHRSRWWADLEAGDALIFHGKIAHRGASWPKPRLAVAMRFVPLLEGEDATCRPSFGGRLQPVVVHPRNISNLACSRLHWLPRRVGPFDELDTSLPEDEDWGRHAWAARLVRNLAAAATSAAFRARETSI